MLVDIAFFDADILLLEGQIICTKKEEIDIIESSSGHIFEIKHQFKEPACPVFIICKLNNKELYKSALNIGVHQSEDWESINLGDIHTLGFRCNIKIKQ